MATAPSGQYVNSRISSYFANTKKHLLCSMEVKPCSSTVADGCVFALYDVFGFLTGSVLHLHSFGNYVDPCAALFIVFCSSIDVTEEAKKLIGTGNRHLVMGDVVSAVNVFQEACGML